MVSVSESPEVEVGVGSQVTLEAMLCAPAPAYGLLGQRVALVVEQKSGCLHGASAAHHYYMTSAGGSGV